MFICETCLNQNYKNFAIPFSLGNCDDCGEKKVCVDIPSKDLIPKKQFNESNNTSHLLKEIRERNISPEEFTKSTGIVFPKD